MRDEDKCMKDHDEDGGYGRPPITPTNVKLPVGGSAVQGPYRGIEGETFTRDWEEVGNGVYRLRVPGGWLARYSGYYGGGICFTPDCDRRWVLPKR